MVTCFDPTGARVARGDQQGLLSVSQRTPCQVIWQQRQPAAITTVAWSWDGAYLASGDAWGNIRLWDAQTGVLVQSSQGHQGAVAHLAWSPTTYLLTSSADREAVLRIWNYTPLLHARQVKGSVEKGAGLL